jgi:Na+/H+ antiporter NhaC
MRNLLLAFLFLLTAGLGLVRAQADSLLPAQNLNLTESPEFLFRDGFLEMRYPAEITGKAQITINGEEKWVTLVGGTAKIRETADEKGKLLLIESGARLPGLFHLSQKNGQSRFVRIPLWLTILPPMLAILMALVFREVIVSLFVGVWSGAFVAGGMRIDSLYYFLQSFFQVVGQYIPEALTDFGHISVIVFSLLIGAMVGLISRNGGMAGVVNKLSVFARSPRSAQAITWLLGVAIFFDDYANTLIVGNTMRSVTDRFRVSREKLAYIVDSTAAPVASVAFITTWIGAELGYIDDGISQIPGLAGEMAPYSIFLNSLRYSFYPVLTLLFILMLVYQRRDYGSMYQAELRARQARPEEEASETEVPTQDMDEFAPTRNAPRKWADAFFPVLMVILVTLYGLLETGMQSVYQELLDAGVALSDNSWGAVWSNMNVLLAESNGGFFMKLGKLIGNADSYMALLWSSLSGVTLALIMTLARRSMKIGYAVATLIDGMKAILPAILILTLAWSLALVTEELHTADFLSGAVQGALNPYLLPGVVFVLAALISFSTGSSWSTMAILYPLVIPTSWALTQSAGMDETVSMEILYNVISVVLAASVLGDHCSPISDTTILSSLASGCHHIDHVRTQLPYALTVGGVSLFFAVLSTFLGGGWLLCSTLYLVGIVLLWIIVRWVGKVVPESNKTIL